MGKSLLLILGLLSFGIFHPKETNQYTPVNTGRTQAFSYGEKITYKVRYNLYFNINVGEVNFEIKPNAQNIAGSNCYQMVATGKTYGFYDPFFRVRDRYESYIDTKTLLPLVFIRNVEEGNIKFQEYVIFNRNNNTAKSTKKEQSIPPSTQDMLSAIYYARTIDYSNAKIGQNFMLHAFIDDSTYHCGVKYMGKEVVKTDMGSFNCLKLQPILIAGRVFESQDQMVLWVTDDANHIPVRIQSGISVGKIRVDISGYSGLRNELTAKI